MQTAPIAILGLVSLFVGWLLTLVLPMIQYAAWGILALGIILLAIAFVIDFRRVRGALVSKRGKFGTSTTIMVSIFIGIILIINAISIGSYHRFDFTGLAQFTLASQTKEVLAELETPVEALMFFVPGDPYGIGIDIGSHASSLLEEYQNFSDKLSVETIDPDEHPDQARQYNISQYQTVVFKGPEGYRLVFPQEIVLEAEHAFTSAILEVTGIIQKKVYFLTGHGEVSISSTADNGYNSARAGLRDNLYQVGILDLLLTPAIPEDCAALVIAGPNRSMVSNEIEIIEEWIRGGGPTFILLNPDSPPELKQLLSNWGIQIEEGIVVDETDYAAPSKDSPLVTRLRNYLGLSTIYFPGATAIIPAEELPETLEIIPLAWTTSNSWLERDFNPDEEPRFDEGTELKGPLALGVLISPPIPEEGEEAPIEVEEEIYLVVIGDSDFATNQHFINGNNSDLFLTSVRWLTAGEEIISIDRKVLQTRRLLIGPEQSRILNITSIGLLPLILIVIGGIVWWRRR